MGARVRIALVFLFASLVACTSRAPTEDKAGFYVAIPQSLNGVSLSGTPAGAGQVITSTSSTTADWEDGGGGSGGAPSGAAGGDLAGTYPNPTYGGIVPAAKLPPATTSDAGTIMLAGNLGGTNTSPTVTGLTFGSDTRGDIAYRGATVWARLGAGTSGQALITGGAGADPAWGSSFGAQNITSTGAAIFGTNPSATGTFRGPGGANTLLSHRTNANSGDLAVITTTTGDAVTFGETATGATTVAGTSVILNAGGSAGLTIFNGSTTVGQVFNFIPSMAAPQMSMQALGADTAPLNFTMRGGAPFASAVTNLRGGNVHIQGAARLSTSGRRGGVSLQLNSSTSENMLEATDVQAQATSPSRVLSLLRPTAISAVEMPTGTGDLVTYVGSAAVVPTVSPVSGTVVYANSGVLGFRNANGGQVEITGTTQTTVGAAGGGSALPATPVKYMNIVVGGTAYSIPLYTP